MTALPLQRFTVLEVNATGVPLPLRLAVSLAGKIAADLGATVLKIEPPGGDPVRTAPPLLAGAQSALFEFLNTSKRSLVLDLGGDQGRAALAHLLDSADACLFEEPAGVAELIRAGRATPIEIAPFPRGMNAAQPYSEFTLLALGGLLHMVGEPDRPPLRLGGHHAAYAAGLTAFTGLAAALAARERGTKAAAVRVSLSEVVQWVNWKAASGAEASGGLSPGREGRQSEFQLVPCRDGHVAVVYTASQWPATRELIGDTRLADPKFATRAGRRANVGDLYDILRPWFAGKTRAEIQSLAQARGVPFGPVFAPAELLDAEQYVARGFLAELVHPDAGRLRLPQLPVQWNGRSFAPRLAPALGSAQPGQKEVVA